MDPPITHSPIPYYAPGSPSCMMNRMSNLVLGAYFLIGTLGLQGNVISKLSDVLG